MPHNHLAQHIDPLSRDLGRHIDLLPRDLGRRFNVASFEQQQLNREITQQQFQKLPNIVRGPVPVRLSTTTHGDHLQAGMTSFHKISKSVNADTDESIKMTNRNSEQLLDSFIAIEEKAKGKKSQCQICKKWFYKTSDLKRHTMIHTGEKPYNCDICCRSFNRNSSLRVHMMIHYRGEQSGESMYLG